MELLERVASAPKPVPCPSLASVDREVEHAARRSLRAQIARLERELATAFVTAYPIGGLEHPAACTALPRLLDLGELELVRDELTERLRSTRMTIAKRADVHAANRLLLEGMLLEPAGHRFARVSQADIGEPGCGVWQVRPRHGLIGMLMGWWEVKLSSGCPLGAGRADRAARNRRAAPAERDRPSPRLRGGPRAWQDLRQPTRRGVTGGWSVRASVSTHFT